MLAKINSEREASMEIEVKKQRKNKMGNKHYKGHMRVIEKLERHNQRIRKWEKGKQTCKKLTEL